MMREKDQIFIGTLIFALAANLVSIVVIEFFVVGESVVMMGNALYWAVYSVSPLLAFLFPFAMLGASYGVYRRNENAGLVLAGVWYGIAVFDLIVRVTSLYF